jgi:hypothetical protein
MTPLALLFGLLAAASAQTVTRPCNTTFSAARCGSPSLVSSCTETVGVGVACTCAGVPVFDGWAVIPSPFESSLGCGWETLLDMDDLAKAILPIQGLKAAVRFCVNRPSQPHGDASCKVVHCVWPPHFTGPEGLCAHYSYQYWVDMTDPEGTCRDE